MPKQMVECHQHPGGKAVLLDRAGDDCSLVFEDIGHSSKARRIRDSLYIGELAQPEWRRKETKPAIHVNDKPVEGEMAEEVERRRATK